MKASEIQPDDEFLDPDQRLRYTVVKVHHDAKSEQVIAMVRYTDGGSGQRCWQQDRDVPLTRPR